MLFFGHKSQEPACCSTYGRHQLGRTGRILLPTIKLTQSKKENKNSCLHFVCLERPEKDVEVRRLACFACAAQQEVTTVKN